MAAVAAAVGAEAAVDVVCWAWVTAADGEGMTEALVYPVALALEADCCGHCWESLGTYWRGLVAAVVGAGWTWAGESGAYSAAAQNSGCQGQLR